MKKRESLILMVVLLSAVLLCQGCHSSHTKSYATKIVADGFATLQTKRCVDLRWFGANRWRLSEDGGYDGGGHGPYEIHLNTDEPHFHTVWALMEDNGPIAREPNMLLPLFDSDETDTLLAAMFLFNKVYIDYDTAGQGLCLTKRVSPVAAKLRSLLYTHRDVRVRCMAATILKDKSFLALEDIDRMLSDSDLSVQIVGVESANLVSRQINIGINPVLPDLSNPRLGQAQNEEGYTTLNSRLISICLEHLNENHFYIRNSCYSVILAQIGRTSSKPYRHFAIDFPDTFPRIPSWWSLESLKTRREMQIELMSWWDRNKDTLRMASGVRPPEPTIDG